MSETMIIALCGLAGSGLGTLGGIIISSKLTNYRIEQLEKKVDKHNGLVERMYCAEGKLNLIGEKIDVANHRIADLEGVK